MNGVLRVTACLVLVLPAVERPAISSLSPSAVVAGDTGFWLTVRGSGFVQGSIIRIDGEERTTTFMSAATIAASILASDISRVGVRQVSVQTPLGSTSPSSPLTVTAPPPAPRLISIAPTTITAGGPAIRLTVTGADFADTSLVEIDGETRPTFDVSATTLVAHVSASDRAAAGTLRIRVVTPAPGGGASRAAEMRITPGATEGTDRPGPQKAQSSEPGPQKAQIAQGHRKHRTNRPRP